MAGAASSLFEQGDDFALCDRLFLRIGGGSDDPVDVAALPDAERTVYLVWGASGLIENGGFLRLFGWRLVGDPHLALTRRAFEEIGCSAASAAFGQAFAAFPGGRPPADVGERALVYSRRAVGLSSDPDLTFFAAGAAIERGLADWARARRPALAHLA